MSSVPFGQSAYVHPDDLRNIPDNADMQASGGGDASLTGMSGCFRREDEEIRRTGIIQSERRAFEMARERFRSKEKGGAA